MVAACLSKSRFKDTGGTEGLASLQGALYGQASIIINMMRTMTVMIVAVTATADNLQDAIVGIAMLIFTPKVAH